MVLEKFSYNLRNKKKTINAKPCKSVMSKFIGLMFKDKSPPLLFTFDKEKNISIHSFFCRPFTVIWLDKNKKAIQIKKIKTWMPCISGYGKYLLEIPSRNYSTTTTIK